jgi:methyltransferase (TIGR00027 family)
MSETPINDVSDTAFWIAHHRALESARDDALFSDPLAGLLAGERGREIARAMPHARVIGWTVAIRTRIIDEFIGAAVADGIDAGVDAVLNLGAGLDARPYRMDLPASLLWVEADYPRIVEYKESRLAGERPRCRLERAKVDLADAAARRALLAAVNARAKRLLVLTEGVVPYLSAAEAGALADDLRGMDRAAGWVVDYFSPAMMKYRERMGMGRAMRNAPFRFKPADPFAFFAEHGWRLREIRYFADEAERLGRPRPMPVPMRLALKLLALFAPKERLDRIRKFAGYMVLEPSSGNVN